MYLTLLITVDNTKSHLACCSMFIKRWNNWKLQVVFDCLLQTTNNIPPICLFLDADPALINAVAWLASKLPRTHYFLCIVFHIQENLWKNLASKLGQEYQPFYKEFLHTWNSLFSSEFYHRWTQLLEKYSQTQEYFNWTLNNYCQAWAKYYQIKYFTAGIQNTQWVKVMNCLIKEGTSSTSSLCNLHNQTQKLLDNEAQ
jgi:hypothetical protein